MAVDDDFELFLRLTDALRPYLNDLVIIGGWAHRLYRFRPEALVPRYAPLFTEDADVALAPGLSLPQKLNERLIAGGFVEEFLGEDHPPVTHYRLRDEDSQFYVEFLTPLIGGGGRPGKRSRDTAEIAGVVAQKLRHLDILLIEPWPVTIPERVAGRSRGVVTVQVPNPASFIAQKILVHKVRKPEDRAKDVLYVHDAVELFAPSLAQLRELWPAVAAEQSDKTRATVEKLAHKLFEQVTDAIRGATRAAEGRDLPPEEIRLRCEIGLREIFT